MPKVLLPFHDHQVSYTEEYPVPCSLCDPNICPAWVKNPCVGFNCTECGLEMHKECVDRFRNQPFQCNHSLKFIGTPTSLNNIDDDCCHFCRCPLTGLYVRCTICNINIDLRCHLDPPPLTIFQPKHHKHHLTILSRLVTFTCNACGVEGDRNPYVCLECNLMVHKDCIEDLPRVISINRHDHRISHTFHLGQREGDWKCGVCRKTINWVYGGYKCLRCPSYAVHSRCATRKEVWDGIELEDVPEEEEEIEDPFKIINKTDIIHFSHEEHILRLDENYVTDSVKMRCQGCILAINGDPCFKCLECDFILHKACASLPRKKRHLLHNHKLNLRVDEPVSSIFECKACGTSSNGFRYKCEESCADDIVYDVRCCSVSEPFHHDLHPHDPLYWTLEGSKQCKACGTETDDDLLNCTVCDEYALCMRCATLPRKVKHICDDHVLSLCQDVANASGDLWCDVCETKTDPKVRYYTCEECGVSLHINCVLGDLYYLKVGYIQPPDSRYPRYPVVEVLPNNSVTRPICVVCEVRCKFPFFMKGTKQDFVTYVCSRNCTIRKSK